MFLHRKCETIIAINFKSENYFTFDKASWTNTKKKLTSFAYDIRVHVTYPKTPSKLSLSKPSVWSRHKISDDLKTVE